MSLALQLQNFVFEIEKLNTNKTMEMPPPFNRVAGHKRKYGSRTDSTR